MSNQTTEKVQFGTPSLKRAEQSQVTQQQILTLMLTTHHSIGLFQTAFCDQPTDWCPHQTQLLTGLLYDRARSRNKI